MTEKRKQLGKQGEEMACSYLRGAGLSIIARNWRCQAGEADIIACDDEEIVFIEVKTRSSPEAGLPEDAVTPTKRKRYERIAMYYLLEEDPPSSKVRFDVIAIFASAGRALLRHHRDAFSCGG